MRRAGYSVEMRVRACVALAAFVTAALTDSAWAQGFPADFSAVFGQMLLSPADMAAVTQGEVVSTLPRVREPRELAVFGVVRMSDPRGRLMDAVPEIGHYGRTSSGSQIGRFSTPPVLEDVASLTLDEADLQGLRSCRPGRCAIKLSASMVQRFAQDVRWSAPDWRDQATSVFRAMLVEYARAYITRGSAALPDYVDQRTVVSLSDETRSLWLDTWLLRDHEPDLLAQLVRPPDDTSGRWTHTLYWSKEQFGFKPTVTVFDVALFDPTRDGPTGRPRIAISTQLYATHYFEGSVALTIAAMVPGSSSRRDVYLMHLHRSRIDSLRHGRFTWLARYSAGRRLRGRLEDDLHRLKARLDTGIPSRLAHAGPAASHHSSAAISALR